jgi:hypothetical protein
MTAAEGGDIFISYRRQEGSHLAGRLSDRLADRFGEGQVFIDVDTIEPGVDFAEEIFRAVAACKVLLVVIGPAWLTAADERGRRLDDPDDIVRLEIEAALDRGVRVIPILTEGAVMPTPYDLPESLAGLARRNALPIRHESFRSDAGRLITAIEPVLSAASDTGTGRQSSIRANIEASTDPHDVRTDGNALLADAEPASQSITDDSSKASALARIAGELAATNPDRAARVRDDRTRAAHLLLDARRSADSITDEGSKARALAEVVEVLAATDPDRAERLAQTITDEGWKADALADVAEALAATDPDRAERLAQTITDGYWKVQALLRIVKICQSRD